MTHRKHSIQLAIAVLSLVVFTLGLSGCRKPKAKLVAGNSSASFDAPNQLLTALTIKNDGSEPAEEIHVNSLSVPGGALILPTSLPVSLGTIAPAASTVLDANFTDSSAKPNNDYTVEVEGTFEEDGHHFKFSLDVKVHTPPASPGSGISLQGTTNAINVKGAPYPAQPPSFGEEVNEGGHARPVPTGPSRPVPPSKQSNVQPAPKGKGGGSASIDFSTNDPLGISGNTIAEPSGASGGGVVFETANSYAAYSTNGGATFTNLNPTTIFPNNVDGGFCCDQVVQYAPTIDRFIWVMQYRQGPGSGPNRYRIASASPATVISSSGTSWSYFDITSTAVIGTSNNTWLDYPDTSIGDNSFYLCADDVNNGGHVIVRVPLSDIQNGGTINYRYTTPSDSALAYGSHLTQNTRDEVFWAGHFNSSTIRIFNWAESSTSYSWRDINIGSWPNTPATLSSTTPDGQDWLNKLSGFPGTAVLGLARSAGNGDTQRQNQLYFAWTGGLGNGFKQVQVQWITLDRNNNFALVNQQQVWNPGYAYAYPAFAVNSNNEIGMSLEWGGGGNYENHVAGFWGDYVVYEITSSDVGTNRFGDYVTIRRNTADPTKFDAFGYGLNKITTPGGGTKVDVHYIVFSR